MKKAVIVISLIILSDILFFLPLIYGNNTHTMHTYDINIHRNCDKYEVIVYNDDNKVIERKVYPLDTTGTVSFSGVELSVNEPYNGLDTGFSVVMVDKSALPIITAFVLLGFASYGTAIALTHKWLKLLSSGELGIIAIFAGISILVGAFALAGVTDFYIYGYTLPLF